MPTNEKTLGGTWGWTARCLFNTEETPFIVWGEPFWESKSPHNCFLRRDSSFSYWHSLNLVICLFSNLWGIAWALGRKLSTLPSEVCSNLRLVNGIGLLCMTKDRSYNGMWPCCRNERLICIFHHTQAWKSFWLEKEIKDLQKNRKKSIIKRVRLHSFNYFVSSWVKVNPIPTPTNDLLKGLNSPNKNTKFGNLSHS